MNPVSFHFAVEGAAGDTECFGGLGEMPILFFKHSKNQGCLGGRERTVMQGQLKVIARNLTDLFREMFRKDLPFLAKNY